MMYYNSFPTIVQKVWYFENYIDNLDEDIFNINLQEDISIKTKKSCLENKANYFFRDDGNLIIKNGNSNSVYLTFKIYSEKKAQILLSVKSYILCKYWINDIFIGMGKNYYFTELNVGENVFTIQLYCQENSQCNFSCRISDLNYENQNVKCGLLIDNCSFDHNHAYVTHTNNYTVGLSKYKFMIVPNSTLENYIDKELTLKIIDKLSGKIKETKIIKYFSPISLDLTCYECEDKTFDYLILEIEYTNFFGQKCKIHENIFIQNTKNYTEIKQKLNEIIKDPTTTVEEQKILNYCFDNIDVCDDIEFTTFVYETLLKFKNGVSLLDSYRTKGEHCIFYHSKLDNRFRKIYVYVSENLKQNVSYPLLMNFLYFNNNNYVKSLSEFDGKFIAVDICSLGFTSGSYIGEAAIEEVINIIKSIYIIDEQRIYGTGFSNGATALWSYAIHHPHIFAGLYLLSGYVNCDYLCNIKGKCIINLSSDIDGLNHVGYELPTQILANNTNYTGILVNKINHADLLKIQFKKYILRKLFSSHNESYPKNIVFKTNNMVHNRAYWMTINKITFMKREAEVTIHVSDDTIYIETTNISCLTLNIPPYINRDKLKIVLNSKLEKFDINNNSITLTINEEKNLLDYPNSNVYKGLGLLYVYLRALQIIIPQKCSNILNTVSAVFAQPKSNGENPNISIDYPVVTTSQNVDYNKSLIVIDRNSNDDFMKSIRNSCTIKCFKDGYVYKGVYTKCDYCIMQITKNIFSENKNECILYINSNSDELLKKNIFTRKVVLSSYFNGYNPYWNNAALIFRDNNYHKIFEFGMEEEKCK